MRLAIAPARTAVLLALAMGCGAETPPSRSQSGLTPLPPSPTAAHATTNAGAGAPVVAASPRPTQLTSKAIALPGTNGRATLDYLVFEPAHARVWAPVGDTGSVDVLDPASGNFTRINGFKSAPLELHGKKRIMGPSSGAFGEGFVYIGNRASNEVCPVDASTLKPSKCLKLAAAPDGVAYIASAKELWVTTPKDLSLTVLDASKPGTLQPKTVIKMLGSPEGYAVDDTHGLFFTNLEDKDQTVAIDVKTHKIKSTWPSACGSDGPRGVAVDTVNQVVMVACTDHIQLLDGSHDGAQLAKVDTGGGVDNVEWLALQRRLYVGAGKAAKLIVIRVDEKGQPTVVAEAATAEGARNPVVDAAGTAYLADPMNGGVLVVQFTP